MARELNDDNPAHLSEHVFSVGQIVFGKFEVLAQLGAGNMGQVYKVRDVNLDKALALKVLQAHARGEKDLLRFQNEARTASKLIHPAVATVYDFGLSEDGSPYLAIEFIEGKTLESLLGGERRLSLPEFLSVFIDVADGLDCAHRNGIIHRDIKPGNIMLAESGDAASAQTKVVDFGLAKSIDATENGAQDITKVGLVMGTPTYMSPEQTRGLTATAQSDLYSLGCVMYEALAGEPPFMGESVMETMVCHQSQQPRDLRNLADSSVPDEVIAMVHRLLEKEPENRLASAADVAEVLIGQLETFEQSQAEEIPNVVAVEPPVVHHAPPVLAKTASDKRFLPIAVAVLIAGSIATAGFLLFGHKAPKNVPAAADPFLEPYVGDGKAGKKAKQNKKNEDPLSTFKIDLKRGTKQFILVMFGESMKDEDFKLFQGHKLVEEIDCTGLDVPTDAALHYLGKLPNLRKLNLEGTKVKTLRGLEGAPAMLELNLTSTKVNDDSMCIVATMPRLDTVKLRETAVTCEGLEKISQLPRLRIVQISWPSEFISKEQLEDFAAKHPGAPFLISAELFAAASQRAEENLQAGKFKDALVEFQGLQSVLKQRVEPNNLVLSAVTTKCAICAYNTNNKPLAEKYFKDAFSYADLCNECDVIKQAHFQHFIFFHSVKDWNKAENAYNKFIKALDKLGDDPERRFECMTLMGQGFESAGRFDKSKRLWKELLALKPLKVTQHADTLATYANAQRMSKEPDQAAANFQKAEKEYEALYKRHPSLPQHGLSNLFYNSSANEWQRGNKEKALDQNWRAIQIAEKLTLKPNVFLEAYLQERLAYLKTANNNSSELSRYQIWYDKVKSENAGGPRAQAQ